MANIESGEQLGGPESKKGNKVVGYLPNVLLREGGRIAAPGYFIELRMTPGSRAVGDGGVPDGSGSDRSRHLEE